MAGGLYTTIERLANRLLARWVPKWYAAFPDRKTGGFYERLGHGFQPVLTGQRRLVTQCRQLAVYSHARMHGAGRHFAPDLSQFFDYMIQAYYVPDSGGWQFSTDDKGRPLDQTYDLYTLAFVIFSLSHYFRASGDERAQTLARGTLDFIDRYFRLPGLPGLAEALDESGRVPPDRPRRHESHMHLMEACLFAAEVWNDPAYRRMADEMASLFVNTFYDADTNILSEYYAADMTPMPQNGHLVLEPGHYCEWIWLLKKQARLWGDETRYDALCRPMLEWACTKGWDDEYGGIYDELDETGVVIADTKRLWPFAEALKANALMIDSGVDKVVVKRRVRGMVEIFDTHYMQERGFWTEWLRRDLTPETDYMPGTTPYHVYFGIMETLEMIRARGRTRSLVAGPQLALYRFRRRMSEGVRGLRMGMGGGV